jgi:ribose transport system substrate-binding protein
VDIVTEQNLGGKVKVVGFDADPISLASMEAKKVDALAVQNPYEMGRRSIKTLRALVEKDEATLKEVFPNHGQTDGDIHDTGVRIIVPDDSSPVKKDQLSEKTELMTLEQFRAWLAENKLKGS